MTVQQGATTMLVCEGACNGGRVQVFDAAVKVYGHSEVIHGNGRTTRVSLMPQHMLEDARTFKHTPHIVHDAQATATCLNCGTTRRWGTKNW